MGIITQADLDRALPYPTYRDQVAELLEQGKATGTNHSEAYLHYSKMGLTRMRRLDKTTVLSPELTALLSRLPEMEWIVLSEGWCGDAGQNVPLMYQLAQASQGRIRLGVLLRDENLSIMDEYLTDGGRSIPKLIMLQRDTLEELGTWGPRPVPVQEIVQEHKRNPVKDYSEISEEVQRWYAQDKTQTPQRELLILLQGIGYPTAVV